MNTDRIEREIVIDAPVQRVWQVVTQADHLGRWFGDAGAEVDLRPGGALVLRWKEFGTGHHRVESVEPPTYFAFRGSITPDATDVDDNSTLVEFFLTPQGESTVVRVVESGFDGLALPAGERARYREGNVDGWRIKGDELRDYVAALVS
ncbi:uncharacterized protein YndB with AHSA1/START domain [Herbihabitans rhizosphaerae]|uniref:Uncharacterized protein YndB with AHSA1/START domain n=1 Tax=Herbihabitans rhizosphaerae TaxID=1872711 RepID=A0A4Q7KL02_9PSEU|nr:SRPBCC family protein [Herbihabitans rhizosphaerae]RZS36907.1 uncharacterized protein YndB with AHSA1/START domain [Herbihabitans rhizosphaerae]